MTTSFEIGRVTEVSVGTAATDYLTFQNTFPIPQPHSWKECNLPVALTSRVMSCLRGKQLTMGELIRRPKSEKNIGGIGHDTRASSDTHPFSPKLQTSTAPSSPLPSLHGCGQVSTAGENRSWWARSRQRWHPLPRPLNWQMNRARSIAPPTSTSRHSSNASKECAGETNRPSPS